MKLPPEINKIVTSNRTPLAETKKMKFSVSMQNLLNHRVLKISLEMKAGRLLIFGTATLVRSDRALLRIKKNK